MTIDADALIKAVRACNVVGELARADNVSAMLSPIAGRRWDHNTVADDLAELESHGKLKRAQGFEWEGSEPLPKTRIAYVLPGD